MNDFQKYLFVPEKRTKESLNTIDGNIRDGGGEDGGCVQCVDGSMNENNKPMLFNEETLCCDDKTHRVQDIVIR